jgi:hypothetical protein
MLYDMSAWAGLGRNQFNYELGFQEKSQQYFQPQPSPAEGVRYKVRRPALNVASRRACKRIRERMPACSTASPSCPIARNAPLRPELLCSGFCAPRRSIAGLGRRSGSGRIALGHHRYERLYVTGFVAPASGETVWYLSNGIDKPFFAKLLAAFARETAPAAIAS